MLWTAALQALVAKELVVRDALEEAGKPKLPANFHATMYMTSTYSDVICEFTATGSCEGHPWVMSQDDDNKLFAQSFRVENRFAPASYAGSGKSFFNTTSVTTSTGSFDVMNGLCYPMDYGGTPSTYTNMWQWVPLSRRRADAVVDGTECAVWALSLAGVDLLVAVGKDSETPVEYNISNTKANYSYSFRFVSFAEGADPDVLRGFDEAACASPPTCAEPGATGAVTTADAYIFHPENNFNISNQDVGDALGDTFFVCEDLQTGLNPGADHAYAWISRWNLTYTSTVGQYLNCNAYGAENHCMGANDRLVGREAALGLGAPLAGQCDANEATGVWWSLPAAGRCPDGAPPSDDCSWQATRVKTINGSCLFDLHNFNATCAADARAPFKTAHAAFERAFASDDPADGGCPPLDV